MNRNRARTYRRYCGTFTAIGAASLLLMLSSFAFAADEGTERAVVVTNGAVMFAAESMDDVFARERVNPTPRSGRTLPPGRQPGYEQEKAEANARAALVTEPPGGPGQLSPHLHIAQQGPSGCGCEPPDPIITVGPSHILVGVNDTIQVYNKSSGASVWSSSWESFFSTVNPAGAGSFTSDPKVFFDPGSQRYFATILMINSATTKSWWMLATSQSSTPTSAAVWYKWAFDPTIASPGKFADYPCFGFDANAVYITSDMFGGVLTDDMAIFNKSQLVAGAGSPTFTQLVAVTTSAGGNAHQVQPCSMYSAGDCFFVSATGSSGSSIFFYRINNPLSSPTLTKASRAVTSYAVPPNAAQSGSGTLIDTGDTRLINAIWRNNRLWCAHAISASSRAVARWYEFDTSSWPTAPTTAQLANIADASAYYYYPSVTVDSSNNAAVGYTRSSSAEFCSAYHSSRLATDSLNTMSAPVLDHAGTASYTGTRWGDYSGMVIDTVDSTTFFSFQEYADASANRYGTWIQSFTLASACTPPTVNAISNQNATCGVAFTSSTPSTSAGTPPIAWSLSGSPPAGMTINSSTGVVSWPSPTTAGSPFTIQTTATNACGSDTKSWTLTVAANNPTVNSMANASVACGHAYTSATPSTSGGVPPFTWTLLGTPPAGMTINAGTGVVSWPSPVASNTPYTITIQASSSCGSGSTSWTLTVKPGDFTGDGIDGVADIPAFVDALLGNSANCAADVNLDGTVNGLDAQAFVNNE